MEVGRNHDPKPGAGPDIDVWIDTALADQAELGQTFQKRSLKFLVRSRKSTSTSVSWSRSVKTSTAGA